MNLVKALDVSSHSGEIGMTQWADAYADGWRLAVVQAWGGLPGGGSGPNPHCRQQLLSARAADLLTATYIWLPPDDTTETHELIRLAKEAAGDEYESVEFVAMDIEDPHRRPLHPTDPDARLADAIGNVRDKPVIIYTSFFMWQDVMGGSMTFPDYPLWDARWGSVHGLDAVFVPYGGWSECAMRQYQGTTEIHGITADLNVADLDRLGVVSPPPDGVQAELERLRAQLADVQMGARNARTMLRAIIDWLHTFIEE